jgi:hypothetical protein
MKITTSLLDGSKPMRKRRLGALSPCERDSTAVFMDPRKFYNLVMSIDDDNDDSSSQGYWEIKLIAPEQGLIPCTEPDLCIRTETSAHKAFGFNCPLFLPGDCSSFEIAVDLIDKENWEGFNCLTVFLSIEFHDFHRGCCEKIIRIVFAK